MTNSFSHLRLERRDGIATVTLARPDLHNAFNPALIHELRACFELLASDAEVRVAVLTGAGPSFCAGADLAWMQESLHFTREENLADAEELSAMFDAINTLPKPLIGRINGAALGGGVGLVACCDIAIASDQARFGFTEVKVGLIPAVIARFVLPKVGVSRARALFITGERFGAAQALSYGLIHAAVAPEKLDAEVERVVGALLSAGPVAVAAAKTLIHAVSQLGPADAREYTVRAIAELRRSPEAQEGIAAFLQKRKPSWSR